MKVSSLTVLVEEEEEDELEVAAVVGVEPEDDMLGVMRVLFS
jgi:hypothetical protein